MSFWSSFRADLRFAAAHPSTVKKELAAVATSVTTDIAAFNTLLPNVSGNVQAVLSVIQAIAVFILTFAGTNTPIDDVKARLK